MITVAVISPKNTLEVIRKTIEKHDFSCRFHEYVYNQLNDIDQIYAECKNDCDVIFLSGELGYHYLLRRFPDNRIPCAYITCDSEYILSVLIRFMIEHPDIPPERIYVDFLTEQNHFLNVPENMPTLHMPYFFHGENYDYEHIIALGKELWDTRKIDFVISRSINILSEYDKMGIPYMAIYPTEKIIQSSIQKALDWARLEDLKKKLYALTLIKIPPREGETSHDTEYRRVTMHKALVDYRLMGDVNFSIRQAYGRFILRSDMAPDTSIRLRVQKLLSYLKEQVDFDFNLGTGFHENEGTSQYYAEKALLESERHGTREGFLMFGKAETLIGPLSSNKPISYSYTDTNVTRLANSLGIEESNLLSLVSLFKTDPDMLLTVAELAPILGITPRSVRRILIKLADLGVIYQVVEESPSHRGRPGNCYRFDSEAFRKAL